MPLGVEPSQQISIHALREEGDAGVYHAETKRRRFLSTPSARRATLIQRHRGAVFQISIHALREEGDIASTAVCASTEEFLSTPSARRATPVQSLFLLCRADFYPRPPRGGRPQGLRLISRLHVISIHALREEGDGICPSCGRRNRNFYPRPPRGGRREEVAFVHRGKQDFYPRPPRGGRPTAAFSMTTMSRFLSTPSARRATGGVLYSAILHMISIHALREEGDFWHSLDPRS